VNRERRRAVVRAGGRVVVAVTFCPDCGAPMCPECGEHASRCEHCGEWNCERCGAYILQLPSVAALA